MTSRPDFELMLNILKALQASVARLEVGQRELKEDVLSLRSQVNGFQADILRVERGLASVEVRLDRIDTRLGLHDA